MGTSGTARRHCCCHSRGGTCSWHPVGKAGDAAVHPTHAGQPPRQRMTWPPTPAVPMGSPGLSPWPLFSDPLGPWRQPWTLSPKASHLEALLCAHGQGFAHPLRPVGGILGPRGRSSMFTKSSPVLRPACVTASFTGITSTHSSKLPCPMR